MLDLNIYNIAKQLMEQDERLRKIEHSKSLLWGILMRLGYVKSQTLTWDLFKEAPSFESITRAIRKVKEDHPELDDSKEERKMLESQYRDSANDWISAKQFAKEQGWEEVKEEKKIGPEDWKLAKQKMWDAYNQSRSKRTSTC